MTWTDAKAAKAGSGGAVSRSDTGGKEIRKTNEKKEGGPGMCGESGICQLRYVN